MSADNIFIPLLTRREFSVLSHSEKAHLLAREYSAIKCQGRRTDLIEKRKSSSNPHDSRDSDACAELRHRFRTDEKISQDYSLSRDKVAKYIRMSNLIPYLFEQVDAGEIAFLAAHELSFIEDKDKQQQITEFMRYDGYKLDMKKAALMREYYESKRLTEDAIVQILSGDKTRKPKNDKPKAVKIKPAVITKYFTAGQTQKQIEDTIDKALALYFADSGVEKEADVG